MLMHRRSLVRHALTVREALTGVDEVAENDLDLSESVSTVSVWEVAVVDCDVVGGRWGIGVVADVGGEGGTITETVGRMSCQTDGTGRRRLETRQGTPMRPRKRAGLGRDQW